MKAKNIGIIGIYKITSPSGKVYIGQSWNIKKRFQQYRCPSYSKPKVGICYSFFKYSVKNHTFELIHRINNHTWQEELNYWENFYWKDYKNRGFKLLNLVEPNLTDRLSDDFINIFKRPKSDEHKKKIGIANKGKVRSEEARMKNSIVKKGQYPGTAKKVINKDTLEIYPSARVASEMFKISHSTIKSMLNGSRKNTTNLIYYEDWNNTNSN